MRLATFEGVTKRYGDFTALDSLDLEVHAGEVLGLLGPNGAGKTTALKILTGLIPADAGRVTLQGRDLQENPLEARRSFAYVPDGAPLYSNLSPREHLHLVGHLHGLPEADLRAEATRLLEALELGDRGDDPVGSFSRGMRQKAALACALLAKPPLLILDEPLSGLDAPTTSVVKAVLLGWARRGGAVIYTSHLLDVVERVCDRMAILAQGERVALGTMEELRGKAEAGSTLEEVFRRVTRAEDPGETALRILGN